MLRVRQDVGASIMSLLLRYKIAKAVIAGLTLLWLATLLWGLSCAK